MLSVNFDWEKRSKIKQTANDSYKFTKKLSRLSRWIKSRWDRCCRPDGILFSGAGEGARIALYSASGGGNAWRDVTSDVVLSFPPIGSRISSPLSSTILQTFLRTHTHHGKETRTSFPFLPPVGAYMASLFCWPFLLPLLGRLFVTDSSNTCHTEK